MAPTPSCCGPIAAPMRGGNRGKGLGGQRGLNIQGLHVRRAHKDTRINSRGCREGPIENAYVQDPEVCTTPPGC